MGLLLRPRPGSKNLSNTGPKMAELLDLMGYPGPLPTLFASQVLGFLSTMLVFSNMYYVKYVLRCTLGDDSFGNHNRPLASYQYSPRPTQVIIAPGNTRMSHAMGIKPN